MALPTAENRHDGERRDCKSARSEPTLIGDLILVVREQVTGVGEQLDHCYAWIALSFVCPRGRHRVLGRRHASLIELARHDVQKARRIRLVAAG